MDQRVITHTEGVARGRPLAYSYIRFSHERQAEGASVERQKKLSRDYAERMGFELVESYQDLAVSAFSGANQSGDLGRLLAAVQSGRIPRGSHLLVESLDRVSRQKPRVALTQFLSMIDMGLTIHTLMDGAVYSAASVDENAYTLFQSIAVMCRANEESETKSKRIKERKDQARKAAEESGRVMTAMCPAWLRVVGTGANRKFEPIPERARIVQRIFELNAGGVGAESICKILNGEGIPQFGTPKRGNPPSGWLKWTVLNMLRGRAVCGDYEPRRLAGQERRATISGYFPRIIDEMLWERAKQARTENTKGAVMEEVEGPGDHTEQRLSWNNLFSGICVCSMCGGPLTVRRKGVPKPTGRLVRRYFICDNYQRGFGCKNKRNLEYDTVEKAILDHIWQISVDPEPAVQGVIEIREIENRIGEMKAKAEALQHRIDQLATSAADVPALLPSIRRLADQQKEALRDAAESERLLAAMRAKVPTEEHLDAIRLLRDQALEGDFESRARVNQGLREIIDCVVMVPEDTILVMLADRRYGLEFRKGELIDVADSVLLAHPERWSEWLAKVPERPDFRGRTRKSAFMGRVRHVQEVAPIAKDMDHMIDHMQTRIARAKALRAKRRREG